MQSHAITCNHMQSHAITCNHMQSATHLSHVASKVELGQSAAREPADEAGTQARLSQLDDTCIGPKRRRERARISRHGDRRGTVAAARDGARECDPARARVIQRATGALSNSEPERATVSSAVINGHQWQSRAINSEPERATVAIKGHQRSSVAIKGHQGSSMVISGNQGPSAVISGHQRSSAAIKGHQWPSRAVSGAPSGGLKDSRQVLARLLYGRERVNRPARVHLLR